MIYILILEEDITKKRYIKDSLKVDVHNNKKYKREKIENITIYAKRLQIDY